LDKLRPVPFVPSLRADSERGPAAVKIWAGSLIEGDTFMAGRGWPPAGYFGIKSAGAAKILDSQSDDVQILIRKSLSKNLIKGINPRVHFLCRHPLLAMRGSAQRVPAEYPL
jgi:hypothetical protein